MKFTKFLIGMAPWLIVGCAASVPMIGTTRADDTLKADTVRQVTMSAKFYGECEKIESIEMQLKETNPPGTIGDSEATRLYGNVKERWTVNLCGKKLPFDIKFTPDGTGGTYFLTSPAFDLKLVK